MRDKQLKWGRAWRISIVLVAALTTVVLVVQEYGGLAQVVRNGFNPPPSLSPRRQKREPIKTALLANYLQQTDWLLHRQRMAKLTKNSRILRNFPLTEVNLTTASGLSDEADAAWSPSGPNSSGVFIAFASNRPSGAADSNYHIYRMNRDGSNVTQILGNAAFNPALAGQREPAWNPQAPNKIVFVAPDPYLPPPNPPYTLNPAVTQTDLFVVDTVRPLQLGVNPFRIPLPIGGLKLNPRYLSDGTSIVFSSNNDITAANDANTPIPGGRFNLFATNETGVAASRSRITGVAPDTGTGNDTFPAPSADPTTPLVLFTSDRPGVGPGPRHIWAVRLSQNRTASTAPFQVTGTATATTNSGAPAQEFHPDWHDPTPAARANSFFFASTRDDGNGCSTTHSSIWLLDLGAAQNLTETAGTAVRSLVSIQPPLPPAGVAPYDPSVARCADNLRPSASHAINLPGGTDLVAFSSNRLASSFDIWRSNTVDIMPPILTPLNISGASFPVMAPGVPNDAPGTLVAGGASTPRTPRGGLVGALQIAFALTERESGMGTVRVIFHDLDYDKSSSANYDGCCTGALSAGRLAFCGPTFFGTLERLDDFDNGRLPPASERQAPTIGTPIVMRVTDLGPAGNPPELQPGAVAGDGIYFCSPDPNAAVNGGRVNADGTINLAAAGLPAGRDYSYDIEVADLAGNTFTFDSIWGFSTRVFSPSSQLLLVNDYMQGQAFLHRLLDTFPNQVFAAMPCESYWTTNPGGEGGTPSITRAINSMTGLTTDLAAVGRALTVDSTFDHWRVLSRGAISIDVLSAYAPSRESQFDPTSTLPLATRPQIQVPVSEKCVFWGSPFTGNLIVGPGTLDDPGTQQTINSFVSLGGRILFSGRDIGFALTQNGAQPNNPFFAGTLQGVYVNDTNAYGKRIAPTADRNFIDGPWGGGNGGHYFFELFPIDDMNNQLEFPLVTSPIFACVTTNPPISETAGDAWRGDLMNYERAQLIGTTLLFTDAELFIDSITPRSGAIPVFSSPNGGGAGHYFRNASNGSIVGYLPFGIEMVHRDYRAAAAPRPDRCLNMRAKLIHNIACFFRTGFAIGSARATDPGQGSRPLGPADNIRVEILSGTQVVAAARLDSDNSGRWELHGLPPVDETGLTARVIAEDSNFSDHPEITVGRIHGGFGASQNGRLNFLLIPAQPGSITGRVVDQLNNPVGGVRVYAEMIPPTGSGLNIRRGASLLTDNQGIYTIPGLPQGPAGTEYRLFYNLYTRNRLNVGVGDDITSSIAPVRTFGEALRDDANAPSVNNDNPPPATVPQLVPQGPAVTVTSGQATSVGDTILQAAPGDIAGIVRNAVNAQPITATPVRISLSVGTPPSFAPTNPPLIPTPPVPARTDGGNQSSADGYYEFPGIPANTGSQQYRVIGLALGFDRANLDLAVASGRIMARGSGGPFTDTLNLTPLANPGTINGQIRRLDDSAGIPNATVTLAFQGAGQTAPSTLATTTSDVAGNYSFNGVFPTQASEFFTVSASKTNFIAATSSQFTMAAGQTQVVILSLDPPGSISGVVRIASTGLPIGNAAVTVLDAQGNPLINPDTPGVPFMANTTATVAADARSNNVQFNYRIRDLPPQTVSVRVSAAGFSDQTRAGLVVPTRGELTGQDILLLPLKIYNQGLQMMSHPFNTNAELVTTTMGINPPAFRLARFNAVNNAFEEFGGAAFPAAQPLELGRGYFFLLNQATLNLTREGAAAPTGVPFQIPLFSGWNLVGYPYAPRGDFANGIDWLTSTIRTAQGGDFTVNAAASAGLVRSGLFTFNGAGYSLVSRMTPFGGFWVRALQNNVTLLVSNTALRTQPTLRSSAKLNPFRNFVQRDGRAEGWAFGLVAHTSRARDEASLIGSATNARDSYDAHDTETPPPVQMAPSVSVNFPHPEWGNNAGRYAVDIRAPVTGEKSWEFEVASNEASETVTLSWPNLNANLPREYRVTLVDLDSGQRKYLRTVSSYSWLNQNGQPRRFRLTVGSGDEQRLLVQNLLASATGGGRMQFSFVLSRDAEISLGVMNPAGKVLDQQTLTGRTGLNTVHWSGTNRQGARVPRGVYLLRVNAVDPDSGQQVQALRSVTVK